MVLHMTTEEAPGNMRLVPNRVAGRSDPRALQNPPQVQLADPPVVQAVLTDLPGLLFFSTYTLLVLFWAEIYHQARSLPTSKLRPIFVTANAVVYLIQVCLRVLATPT